jgi:uncharacterized protein YndB with AHSA1/START domain
MSEERAPHAMAVLTRKVYIAAPAEEVWCWVVEPERVEQYHLSNLAERPHAAGDTVQYTNKVGWQVLVEGTVEEIVEGRKLVHTYQLEFDPPEAPSRVIYELIRVGEQMCCLDVRHEGLDPEGETYRSAVASWDIILSSLKTLIETGHPLPWPKRRR